jgi:alpha-1,3-glucan synthase
MARSTLLLLSFLVAFALSLRYDPAQVDYNLNQAQNAKDPLDYTGKWENHDFHPSPKNWRFPFYTLFLDRFVNGDPVNDNANGTIFEQDVLDTQFRHGGDVAGLVDTLDYLQGMGIKVCDLPTISGLFANLKGFVCCRHAVYQLPVEV